MRQLRMFGLCLVAVLATAAVGASSAWALPAWGQCEKVPPGTGTYANANCTINGGAKEYKWIPGTAASVPKPLTSQGGISSLTGNYIVCVPTEDVRAPQCNPGETQAAEPVVVECSGELNTGELSATNVKEVKKVLVTFVGCSAFSTVPCQNASPGEIKLAQLKGKLGYINKATKEVGLLLEPAIGSLFTQFACVGIFSVVVGKGTAGQGCAYPLPKCGGHGIIASITPVNQMASSFTQQYAINALDENVPDKFEGGPLKLLESYIFNVGHTSKWSQAGLTGTIFDTHPGGPIEIKA